MMGSRPNSGKTTLYKYLYFCDFDFYELFESFLIGEAYRKIDNGPAPCHFEIAIDRLMSEGSVELKKVPRGPHIQHKYLSKVEPDTSLLSEKELEVINTTLEKLKHMDARRISLYSHKDLPWKATEDREIIDYELVFYRDDHFSVREYQEDDDESEDNVEVVAT